MKHLLFTGLLLILLSGVAAQNDKVARIEELMLNYNKLGRFNGSVLVAEDNRVIMSKGFGYQDGSFSKITDEFSIYQIGSVTKQFTAAIILKLQEQKKLSVKDKLSKYFPQYPNGQKITIHQLLTHTSGVFNYTQDDVFMNKEATKPASSEKIMALFKDKPFDFAPGTDWKYSNSGYSLLGYIIEKVTGKTYYQVMRELILQPLGMNQSGFHFLGLANGNKTTGHYAFTEKEQTPAPVVDSSVSFSAGALYSSVNDLYAWTKLLNLQNALLKPASWKTMFTPVQRKYGYGIRIDSLYAQRILTHNGGIFGFNSDMMVIPARGISIILLSNVNNPELGDIKSKIAAILLHQKYKMPVDETAEMFQLTEETLKSYEGEYEFTPDFKVTVWVKDGLLQAQPTGQPVFQLLAKRDNFFNVVRLDAQVEFVKGADGKIEKLYLFQDGRKSEAKKIK
jgi:CubicO group peptidase (beta-lactamase class C family)